MKTATHLMGLHVDRPDRDPHLYNDLQSSNHSLCHAHSPPAF